MGTNKNAPLAQPDRVFGYEPKGQGFESLTARQNKNRQALSLSVFVLPPSFTFEPLSSAARIVLRCDFVGIIYSLAQN